MKTDKKKIFISRDLSPDSCLHSLNSNFILKAFSLLEIEYLPVSHIPDTDWYFFYSKNGVRSFYENAERLNFKFDENQKIATIGKSTAKVYEDLFEKKVNAICYEWTNSEFQNLINSDSITFVQAKDSLKRYQDLIDNKNAEVIICYQTKTKSLKGNIIADCYVFTSPKNVEAFFENAFGQSNSKFLAIGKTTALEIEKRTSLEVLVPINPSEEDLLMLINNTFSVL